MTLKECAMRGTQMDGAEYMDSKGVNVKTC